MNFNRFCLKPTFPHTPNPTSPQILGGFFQCKGFCGPAGKRGRWPLPARERSGMSLFLLNPKVSNTTSQLLPERPGLLCVLQTKSLETQRSSLWDVFLHILVQL